MTEYEIAALALAESRVGIMQGQLAVAQAQVWVTAGLGLLQCLLIAGGLWLMWGGSKQRDQQLAQQAGQFAELIRRGERQGKALERQGEALERQGEALERQGEVLAELLRRTTPKTREEKAK